MFDDNSNDSFLSNFSLAGVQAASSSSVLPPGRHVCTIKTMKLENTKANNGSKMLVILFTNANGVITGRLNIHNVTSETATRIGREQLRALAEHSGVADPDHPFAGGIEDYIGREVGVVVKAETYQGEQRSAVSGFFDPDTAPPAGQSGLKPANPFNDDDVPF